MRISDWSSDVCSSDLHIGPGGNLLITDASFQFQSAIRIAVISQLFQHAVHSCIGGFQCRSLAFHIGLKTDPAQGVFLLQETAPVKSGSTDCGSILFKTFPLAMPHSAFGSNVPQG